MGLIDLASYASAWRGYEYYKNKKVVRVEQLEDGTYDGTVMGSTSYHVVLNLLHPRKSLCSCPHAAGRQVICKHKAAVYFAAFPEAAKDYYEAVIRAQEEAEQEQEEWEDAITQYVMRMTKEELRDALLALLFDGPDWQMENFVAEFLEDDDDEYDEYEEY